MGIEFLVELARPCTPEELGHFRVMVEIINLHEAEPHPTLWLACRDSYPVHQSGETKTLLFGSRSLAWSRNPDEMIQSTHFSQRFVAGDTFSAGAHVHKRGPYPTIASLEGRMMWVFVTPALFGVLAGIGLVAGDYVLTGPHVDDLEAEAFEPLVPWPEPLTEAERAVPWLMLRGKLQADQPPWLRPKAWSLDFSKFTPHKAR
jgi:hypothetical protein